MISEKEHQCYLASIPLPFPKRISLRFDVSTTFTSTSRLVSLLASRHVRSCSTSDHFCYPLANLEVIRRFTLTIIQNRKVQPNQKNLQLLTLLKARAFILTWWFLHKYLSTK